MDTSKSQSFQYFIKTEKIDFFYVFKMDSW